MDLIKKKKKGKKGVSGWERQCTLVSSIRNINPLKKKITIKKKRNGGDVKLCHFLRKFLSKKSMQTLM